LAGRKCRSAFLSGGLAGAYRAVSRYIRFAIYTEPLFKTANDADNRASVAATPTAALDLVGLGLHADRKIIEKITAGLKFLP
jgi:hypothetical protein